MPIYVVCHSCGYVLCVSYYVTADAHHTVLDVVLRLGLRCPRCLARLQPQPRAVLVRPRQGRNRNSAEK